MSNANEMFEKLGYTIKVDNEKLAVYVKKGKTIEIGCADIGYPVVFSYKLNKTQSILYARGILMEELKAINEKVKELGWEI